MRESSLHNDPGGALDPQDEPDRMEVALARVGHALNGKWMLDALLGVGGMATVYAASHRNGSRAAVKVLHPECARDESVRKRFLREGRIANKVEHPARVAVLDDDQSDQGEPFLVMELLEGETLDGRLLRHNRRLSPEEAFTIFDPVLELLGRCHEAGIVHRDIKPGNIFLTAAGQVKVLDFGVARLRESRPSSDATAHGTVLGTPAFIAPEQALGTTNLLDGRADLWSVGACIYTALSGKRLFEAPTVAEQFVLAATQTAPSLARAAPDIPVEIVAFVDKALAFDRAHRFQDAQAMRSEMAALHAALRAGQLTAPAAKTRGTGVVVRGDGALAAKFDEARQEQIAQRVYRVWKQLAVTMANVRQYGWHHPQAARSFQTSFEEVAGALATFPEAVRWEVTPYAFVIGDASVWEPDHAPFDRIPYQLFADGVRKLQFLPGLTEIELRDFVASMMRSFAASTVDEDDMVTALWDRHFEHLSYLAVDSFAEGDAEQREAFQARCDAEARDAEALARLDADWDDDSLEARAAYLNLATELRETAEMAAGLATDVPTRVTLGAQVTVSPEEFHDRHVDALVHAFLEASSADERELVVRPLARWAIDQATLANFSKVFELVDGIVRSFGVQRSERLAQAAAIRLVRAMLPADTLRIVVAGLAAERFGEGTPPELEQTLADGLRRVLTILGDASVFDAVCEHLDAVQSDRLLNVLLGYLKTWVVGREIEVGKLLPRVGQLPGAALVRILGNTDTPQAQVALEMALQSKHGRVRAELMGFVAKWQGDRARAVVQRLLDDPESSIRLEALHAIGRLLVTAAVPALLRRIQAANFHELSMLERKEWMATYLRLNPPRAEATVAEILARWHMVPTEAMEGTRIVAARVLAERGTSEEALKAAHSAARKFWWNSPQVREAAQHAVAAITARRDGGAAAPPAGEGKA